MESFLSVPFVAIIAFDLRLRDQVAAFGGERFEWVLSERERDFREKLTNSNIGVLRIKL